MTFSRFRSSFLSDLYCSHSEVKLVAKVKLIANRINHSKSKGLKAEWAVFLVSEREVNGSNPGVVNYFCTRKAPELNYITCRSRAVLPTLVGLCLIALERSS